MRKLKWREVVWGHSVVGSLSDATRAIFVSPLPGEQKYFYDLKNPYIEAGAGVENILKILRFDVVWRLNYHDHEHTLPFGFRGSIQLVF